MFPVMDPMHRVSGCICLCLYMCVCSCVSLIVFYICHFVIVLISESTTLRGARNLKLGRSKTVNLAALDVRKHLNNFLSIGLTYQRMYECSE